MYYSSGVTEKAAESWGVTGQVIQLNISRFWESDSEEWPRKCMLFSSSFATHTREGQRRSYVSKESVSSSFLFGFILNLKLQLHSIEWHGCPAHQLWVCYDRILPVARDYLWNVCPGAQRARKKSYFYLGFLTLGNSSLQQEDLIMFDYQHCSVLSSLCAATAGSPTINGFNFKGHSRWTFCPSFLLLLTHWNSIWKCVYFCLGKPWTFFEIL